MLVIGLTGGTGSGKGCVGQCFLAYGINTIDTDIVSKEVCHKGSACLFELVSYFGECILQSDGTLDRKKLAEIAFADENKHKALNSITHKHILNNVRDWIKERSAKGDFAVIVDAPLLYESGFDKECDIIIAVVASKDTRATRIKARDGITDEQVVARMSKQNDDSFYTKNADFVIQNDSSLSFVKEQVDDIYSKIIQRGTK